MKRTFKHTIAIMLFVCALAMCFAAMPVANADANPNTTNAVTLTAGANNGYNVTTGLTITTGNNAFNSMIAVPNDLAKLADTTNVTVVSTFTTCDFTMMNNGAYYTSYPFFIFRESADASYQVWARVIRNGMLQVFDGKINGTENLLANVNVWAIHDKVNTGYTMKVESSATGANIYVNEQEAVAVNYTAAPAVYKLDCAPGFYGYISNLSCKVGDQEYLTLNEATEIAGCTVSNYVLDSVNAGTELPSAFVGKEYVKNLTTGEYEKISDLTVRTKITFIDPYLADNGKAGGWWAVPIINFWKTADGSNYGVRFGANDIATTYLPTEGNVNYCGVYHGYYDGTAEAPVYNSPYAVSVEVAIKGTKATIYAGTSTIYSDLELGAGFPILGISNETNGYKFVGISMTIDGEAEYDYNDTLDAAPIEYLQLTNEFVDGNDYFGFIYDEETNSFTRPVEGFTGNGPVVVTNAFDAVATSKFAVVFEADVQMLEDPQGWIVPFVNFWKATNGTEYSVHARYTLPMYVMHTPDFGVDVEAPWGGIANYTDTYHIKIVLLNGVATISVNDSVMTFNLPEGKPYFALNARERGAIYSNVSVRAYSEEETTYLAAAELVAPTAEKFGDELQGGALKITDNLGNVKELPLTDESITVTGYDPELVTEQTVTVKYEDDVNTVIKTFNVTLQNYVDTVVLDSCKTEYLYGEEFDVESVVMTLIWANTDETTATAEEITVSGYDKNTVGEQTVTIGYGAFEEEVTVVVADALDRIEVLNVPTAEFIVGEVDLSAVVIKAINLSGTSAEYPATAEMMAYDAEAIGEVTVTVTYEGKTATFTITVIEKPTQTPSVACGSTAGAIGAVVMLLGLAIACKRK